MYFIHIYRSAFFLFAGDERPKVVAASPSASIGEIGKELGARYDDWDFAFIIKMYNFWCIKNDEYTNVSYIFRWAKASAAVKAGYQAKSDKDKARYAAEKAKFAAKK